MKKIIYLIFILCLSKLATAQSGAERGARSQYQEVYELKNDTLQYTKRIYQEFDKKGRLLMEILLNPDSTVKSKETFSYNRKGFEIENTKYDGSGALIWKTITDYNKFNEKKEIVVNGPENIVMEKTIFSYDLFGRKTEEKTLYGNETQVRRITYNYDKKGALIERTTYNETNTIIAVKKYIYTY